MSAWRLRGALLLITALAAIGLIAGTSGVEQERATVSELLDPGVPVGDPSGTAGPAGREARRARHGLERL